MLMAKKTTDINLEHVQTVIRKKILAFHDKLKNFDQYGLDQGVAGYLYTLLVVESQLKEKFTDKQMEATQKELHVTIEAVVREIAS